MYTPTRRTLLRSVAAAAGSAAVYRTMDALGMLGPGDAHAAALDLPPGSGKGGRVVILGAGVSGLAAAWEMSRAGWHCTVLEATGRAGGRNLTARGGDVLTERGMRQEVCFDREDHLYANLGPARIPYHHRTALGYCKAFGIDLEVFTNDNRAAFFHNRERFGGRPVAGRRVLTDMRGYVAELLAKAVDRGALDAELTPDDKERVRAMLKSFGGLKDDRSYAGSDRAGYRGAQVNAGMAAGEIEERLDFGELLGAEFWEYKLHFSHFLDQNPTLFQPVGGMDALVRAFTQRVGGLVRYGCIVEQIRRQGDGVRIVWHGPDGAERAVLADYAICTIPAPVLKDIPNDFSPGTRAALGSLDFVEAVKVAFQAKRRFWEEDAAIYGGISWTDNDITQVWYPCNGYQRPKGVLVGAYIWSRKPGLRYSALSAPERLRAALAEGAPLHPGYAGEMECGISRAWLKVPFQKGGWPRRNPDAAAALRRGDGPFHFAGDQVTALPGWQEGALLAAHAAAGAIHARFTAR
ncbi:MAG: FAD-dependent oxidoreductase [Rhodospirillaceae bacterium]|nr:FAD-dependent oxidoreductase [Rhodospirillaceae bacterium]MDE0255309.1 FAD-dependent oxidoreductase [Rhodospirillaceae bacterium]MDE0618719.1 FAD-dependent oxidoreductase [Rhodospirillaceae bacterium]